MTPHQPIRILLVDDDEEARVLTGTFLKRIPSRRFYLDWVSTMEEGMAAIRRRDHDLCLIDYQLAEGSGIDLVREAREEGIHTPMILLTGKGRWEVDVEAMEAGVSDYLDKSAVSPELLERAIRYALERARAEEALRTSRTRHRSMFLHAPVGLFRTTADGELLEANPALEEMLGGPSRDELEFDYARNFFVAPAHRQTLLARLDQFGEAQGFESRVERPDGRTLHLRCSVRAHRDDMGAIQWIEGAVEDLGRERWSRDLHGRAARFDWVFRDSGLGILLLDLQGRILDANPAFLREFGYVAGELAGRPVEEVVEPGDREAIAAEIVDVAAGTGADLADSQRRLVTADGTALWAHTRIGLVRDARERPDHLLVLVEELAPEV